MSTPAIHMSAIPKLGEPFAGDISHLPSDLINDLHFLADDRLDGEKWGDSLPDEPQLGSKVNTAAELRAWLRGEIEWVPETEGGRPGLNPLGHPFFTIEHASGGKLGSRTTLTLSTPRA